MSNLLDNAENQLQQQGASGAQIDAILGPARQCEKDPDFWIRQQDGLAVYLSPDRHDFLRLPYRFDEVVACGPRHAIRPLLPYLQQQARYFVLALCQKGCRLYESDPPSPQLRRRPLDCDDLSVADVVGARSSDATLQFHASSPAVQQRGATPVYHGQTPKDEKSEADLKRYCRTIEASVHNELKGETAPLILAAVDHLASTYRSINRYSRLAEDVVEGNPDSWSEEELSQRASTIACETGRRRVDQTIAEVADHLGRPTTNEDIRVILPAAASGAVATLLLDRHGQCCGRFQPEDASQPVVCSNDGKGDDLLELAAAETIIHGGDVLALDQGDIPGASPALALLRRPL